MKPRSGKRRQGPVRGARSPRKTPRLTRAGLWRSAIVLTWVGSFATIAFGLHRLEPASRAANYQNPARLYWVNLPAWLDDPNQKAVLDAIERDADLLPEDNIFSPDLCARIGAGLSKSPWVAAVHRVSKQPDGVVRIHANFYEPLTLAVWNNKAYWVSKDGIRLPGVVHADFIGPEYGLVVTGVYAQPPREGEPWQSERLAAGLKLVEYLNRAAQTGRLTCKASLRAIDVEKFGPTGGPLRIKTIHPNGYITWGLPPGEEYDIEATADQKLATLATIAAPYGQLPNEPRMDLRDPEGILFDRR